MWLKRISIACGGGKLRRDQRSTAALREPVRVLSDGFGMGQCSPRGTEQIGILNDQRRAT